MTNITIQQRSEINAQGQKRNANATPVMCIDTGEIFASTIDAAKHLGVTESNVSHVLCGRQNTCKGKRFCRVSDITAHLEEISANMRERENKVQAYNTIMAERQAKAERQNQIAKLTEKLERRKEICKRIENELHAAQERVTEAENELNALKAKEE